MDEVAANIPGADRRVAVFDVHPDAVLDLLNGENINGIDKTLNGMVEALCDEVIYECNGVRIASDIDGERRVACAHPCHKCGSTAYALLAQKIAELRVRTTSSEKDCPSCNGSGWLPIKSREAHQQYTMMRAVGWFRGIVVPQLLRRNSQSEEAR